MVIHVPVRGSYSSAAVTLIRDSCRPRPAPCHPTTACRSRLPRASPLGAVAVQVEVAGSYSSARRPDALPTSTVPSCNSVAVLLSTRVFPVGRMLAMAVQAPVSGSYSSAESWCEDRRRPSRGPCHRAAAWPCGCNAVWSSSRWRTRSRCRGRTTGRRRNLPRAPCRWPTTWRSRRRAIDRWWPTSPSRTRSRWPGRTALRLGSRHAPSGPRHLTRAPCHRAAAWPGSQPWGLSMFPVADQVPLSGSYNSAEVRSCSSRLPSRPQRAPGHRGAAPRCGHSEAYPSSRWRSRRLSNAGARTRSAPLMVLRVRSRWESSSERR